MTSSLPAVTVASNSLTNGCYQIAHSCWENKHDGNHDNNNYNHNNNHNNIDSDGGTDTTNQIIPILLMYMKYSGRYEQSRGRG